MNRLGTLVLQYYRTLLLYNISFTVLWFVLTRLADGFNPVILLVCKLLGFAGAAGLHYYSAYHTYFYYRNAGITIRRLCICACLADALLSLVFIIPLSLIPHATMHT